MDPHVKQLMNDRINKVLKERTGPSFEQRVKERAAKLQKETKAIEDVQAQKIEQALARAKARPCESPFRSKDMVPMSVEEWGKEHARRRRENESKFAAEDAARQHRMRTREPLFRVSEVEAAFEEMEKRKKEHMRKLSQEEKERWEMLNSMQHRVVDRPLLVENYERPVHVKTETEQRLIPSHMKDLPMERIIKKCVSEPWFKNCQHAQDVAQMNKKREPGRRLHEISYPPKVYKDPPPPRRMVTELDQRLETCVNQRWFKNSEWAAAVEGIRERQNNRVKLCDQTYPPKKTHG